MRCFIAVDLGEEVRANLARAQERLRRAGAQLRWVAPENAHLTLKFLGEVEAGAAADVAAAIAAATAGVAPFRLTARGVSAFPNALAARVVIVQIQAPPQLGEIVNRLEARLERLGFAAEERPFHPHLTIGRVKQTRRGRDPALAALVEKLADFDFGAAVAREVMLMQSELRPQGPIYSVLARAPLHSTGNLEIGSENHGEKV